MGPPFRKRVENGGKHGRVKRPRFRTRHRFLGFDSPAFELCEFYDACDVRAAEESSKEGVALCNAIDALRRTRQ